MKRFRALCLAIVLCLTLTLPAAADVQVPETWSEAVDTVSVKSAMSDYDNWVPGEFPVYFDESYGFGEKELREAKRFTGYYIIGSDTEITVTNTAEDDPHFLWIYATGYVLEDGKFVDRCYNGCLLRADGDFLNRVAASDPGFANPEDVTKYLYAGDSFTFTAEDMRCNEDCDLFVLTVCREYAELGRYYSFNYTYMLDDEQAAAIVSSGKERPPFEDVSESDYFYDAVKWALDNGVTNGTGPDTFGPTETCRREQVVTFLWRAMGEPEPESQENPFTDVSESDYFYKPVLWAVEQGITNGTTPTTFGPKELCRRGQVLTFLWRANGEPEAEGDSALAAAHPDQYYTQALAWAELNGLMEGVPGEFVPNDPSPRSEIVTYLYRNSLN